MSGGVSYYTMPFVNGESLRAQLARGITPSMHDRINVLRDVARALAYAHGEGVIHRDIKPDNILLSGGAAVVTDFGIAKAISASRTIDGAASRDDSGTLTQVGSSIGTPAYMAPEQAVGESIDHRADLYAWGVVAYELLSGAHPFTGKTGTSQLIAAHIAEVPTSLVQPDSEIPRDVSALVMPCLAKNPAERPADANASLVRLSTITTPRAAPTPSSSPLSPSPPRSPFYAVAVSVAALTLVGAGLWFARRSAGAATLDRSVIVLPFENTSRDTTQEYFADGLTDELVSRLVAAGLRVSGRNTAFSFKGKHPTPREVGKVAEVATVLTGQVRRLGEQFQVTAELSNAANDVVLWTYSKDSRTDNAFSVQRELVDSIIARFQLAPRAITQSEATDATVPAKAHDYVLRARYTSNYVLTRDGQNAALALYDSALAIAPRYIDAHLGKAYTLMNTGDVYVSPREVLPGVQAILSNVASIDSSRAEFWAFRAMLGANWLWNWPSIRYDAARARASDPLNFNALFANTLDRLAEGDGLGATATLDTMQRSDPLSPFPSLLHVHIYAFSGMRDSLDAAWRRLPDMLKRVPFGDATDGIAMLGLGRNTEAERALREGEAALGHPSPLRVVALARLGRTADARAQLRIVEQAFGNPYFQPELIGMGAAELGDTTTMYRWLDIGQREHPAWALYLGFGSGAIATHRQEPHFQRILANVGQRPVAFTPRATR